MEKGVEGVTVHIERYGTELLMQRADTDADSHVEV